MKILISQSQYDKILKEDTGFTLRLDKIYSDPERADKMNQTYKNLPQDLIQLRSQSPFIFDTTVQLGLWFVPFIGPYLSAAYGVTVAVKDLKKGNYAEGIIGLITSPLALTKTLRIMKVLGKGEKYMKMLEKINKTGITVLSSQGKQKFLTWGYENFGKDFILFTNLLTNKIDMKTLLTLINKK